MTSTSPPSVVDQIQAMADANPDAPCVIAGEDTFSYQEIWARAGMLADRLSHRGLSRGHKVAILSANSVECIVAMVALVRLGAVWIPVNHRDSVPTTGAILHRFGCHALLVAPKMVGVAEPLCAAAPSIVVAEVLGSGRELRAGAVPAVDAGDEELAAIFTTGGTTGIPKGVAFGRERLAALTTAYARLSAQPGDVYLTAAPLTHVGGRICFAVLASGGTTVVLPAFEPGAVLEAVERHGVTTFTVTPTMLYRLLDHPDARSRDVSSLRALVYGGGPTALTRVKEALDVFGPVLESGFGQTEAPMFMSRMGPDEFVDADGRPVDDARLTSVGRPTPVCDLLLVDEQDQPVPVGQAGEIVVRGDFTMSGYYRDPVLTAARRCGDYWRTGDIGLLDENGYLTIIGRRTDMIITGGFNVYPAEVENAAMEIPGIGECAAFGIPDAEWGECVVLVVVPRQGAVLDPDTLCRELRRRLGGVKTPKLIRVVDALPRNDNGKILKRVIVADFLNETAA